MGKKVGQIVRLDMLCQECGKYTPVAIHTYNWATHSWSYLCACCEDAIFAQNLTHISTLDQLGPNTERTSS